MALAKVSKINIIGHNNAQAEILEVLQTLGFVQIDESDDTTLQKADLNSKLSEIDYQIAGIKFCLDFLSNYNTEKKSLAQKINSKININFLGIEKIVQKFDYQGVIKEIQEIENGINESINLESKVKTELNNLDSWKNLNFVPTADNLPRDISFEFIKTTPNLLTLLEEKFKENSPLTAIEKVSGENGTEVSAVIFYKSSEESKVFESLNSFDIKTIELPSLDTTVQEKIKSLNEDLNQAKHRLEKLEKEAQRLAINQNDLKVTYDYLSWQREKIVGQQKLQYSDHIFSLTGWVETALIEPLKKEVERVTHDFILNEVSVAEDETPPVVFRNSWAKSFEAVTMVYGAPQHTEPDPTPFLAPFFALFFGLAITDAGYGIVMALGTYLAIKFLKIPKESQKLFWVIFWGGISSFIVGALMGGWFSVDLNILPVAIKEPLQKIQLLNPLENPLTFFYLSLGLGVLQVLAGLAVDMWWKFKNKAYKEGIIDSGFWILTIVSLIAFVASKMGFLSASLTSPAKWFIWIGLAGIVLGKASQKKNFFAGLPIGFLGLYGFVGYFSDVLSYSRLLALGLTTGIIGMVVNIIAGLVFQIPFVGWLVALIVLIGGHTFNIGINALGAFIHSGRLQYIEFFPKFMEGGGTLLQPFRKESDFVKINNN